MADSRQKDKEPKSDYVRNAATGVYERKRHDPPSQEPSPRLQRPSRQLSERPFDSLINDIDDMFSKTSVDEDDKPRRRSPVVPRSRTVASSAKQPARSSSNENNRNRDHGSTFGLQDSADIPTSSSRSVTSRSVREEGSSRVMIPDRATRSQSSRSIPNPGSEMHIRELTSRAPQMRIPRESPAGGSSPSTRAVVIPARTFKAAESESQEPTERRRPSQAERAARRARGSFGEDHQAPDIHTVLNDDSSDIRPRQRRPREERVSRRSVDERLARKFVKNEDGNANTIVVSPESSPISAHSADTEEMERLDIEHSRRELERVNGVKKAANKREAEMVAAERGKRTAVNMEKMSGDFTLLSRREPDERVIMFNQILVPDYVKALITTLRSDRTISPLPQDFTSPDGFSEWRNTIRVPLQDMLAKMLKYRFLVKQEKGPAPSTHAKIFFKIVSASGLLAKEGRTRDCYCAIEHGDLAKAKKEKKGKVFQTDTIKGTITPTWNQHLNLETSNLTDEVSVQVWDRIKDQFLGQVVLNMGSLIAQSARTGFISKWHKLEPRDAKYKDRYVGGTILIEAALEDDDSKKKSEALSFEQIQSQMTKYGVDSRALYRTLLRSCLGLDLCTPREGRKEILSDEALSMIKLWVRLWAVSEAAQLTIYLDIIFQKYQKEDVPVSEVLKAFHALYAKTKIKGWFPSVENKSLLLLLENVQGHTRSQVTKYRDFFPNNKPAGALEATILILRMIHRFPLYKSEHPELPDSFREELRTIMTEASISNYQRCKEITTPLDGTDVESVIEGITKLAVMVSDFIELDAKYYQPAFAQYHQLT